MEPLSRFILVFFPVSEEWRKNEEKKNEEKKNEGLVTEKMGNESGMEGLHVARETGASLRQKALRAFLVEHGRETWRRRTTGRRPSASGGRRTYHH